MILRLLIALMLLAGTTAAFGRGMGRVGLAFGEVGEFLKLESDGSSVFKPACAVPSSDRLRRLVHGFNFQQTIYFYIALTKLPRHQSPCTPKN